MKRTRKKRQHKKKHQKTSKKRKKRELVVGMISVPLTPGKKYYQVCGDSYIASSHITWLKRFGVKILPIPYTTKNYKKYMSKINGLYFPSGGAFAGTQKEYYNCCKKFLQLAMKENDKGNHFPIWGGCMGMQQLMIIADGHDDLEKLLQRFDSFNNLLSTLDFTEEGLRSRMMRNATKAELKKLAVLQRLIDLLVTKANIKPRLPETIHYGSHCDTIYFLTVSMNHNEEWHYLTSVADHLFYALFTGRDVRDQASFVLNTNTSDRYRAAKQHLSNKHDCLLDVNVCIFTRTANVSFEQERCKKCTTAHCSIWLETWRNY